MGETAAVQGLGDGVDLVVELLPNSLLSNTRISHILAICFDHSQPAPDGLGARVG